MNRRAVNGHVDGMRDDALHLADRIAATATHLQEHGWSVVDDALPPATLDTLLSESECCLRARASSEFLVITVTTARLSERCRVRVPQ